MRTSYGVVWREGESPLSAGRLELLPSGLRLDGLEGSQDIPYELVAGIRVGRLAGERIDGRPSVVLERRTGGTVTIATVAKQSLVGEIVERLAALQLGVPRPDVGDNDDGDRPLDLEQLPRSAGGNEIFASLEDDDPNSAAGG